MSLEIKVEETERGFMFKDPAVTIEVVKAGDHYQIVWTNEGAEPITSPLEHITGPKEAYREFRESISDYWQHSLGWLFEVQNKTKIDELFRPLAKYQL